jgi:hypothetical protein
VTIRGIPGLWLIPEGIHVRRMDGADEFGIEPLRLDGKVKEFRRELGIEGMVCS